ncbi:MAG TPA: universal stress protein [Gaiellaceae bacterium]|nr:universal stress protein [Gaiellaceae bacterium]
MNMIVVGVDGSRGSEAALRFAAEEAALRGAALEIVSVYHVPTAVYAGGFMPSVDVITALREASEEIAERCAAEVEAEHPEVKVGYCAHEGQPAQVLLQESEDANLLVVGSRGLGGFGRLLLGSVSHQVAQHAACPVVIVHNTPEDGGES